MIRGFRLVLVLDTVVVSDTFFGSLWLVLAEVPLDGTLVFSCADRRGNSNIPVINLRFCFHYFLYRPENTHKGQSVAYQCDLNQLYASREGNPRALFFYIKGQLAPKFNSTLLIHYILPLVHYVCTNLITMEYYCCPPDSWHFPLSLFSYSLFYHL